MDESRVRMPELQHPKRGSNAEAGQNGSGEKTLQTREV